MPKEKDKKEIILSAAAKVFFDKGFTSTNIKEIAEVAGIGKGTIYEYFESKDELFIDSIKYAHNMYLNSKLKDCMTGCKNFMERLDTFYTYFTDLAEESFKTIQMIVLNAIPALKPDLRDQFIEDMILLKEEDNSILRDILTEGLREGKIKNIDVDFASAMLMEMINTCCFRQSFYKQSKAQKEEEKTKLFKLFLEGAGA